MLKTYTEFFSQNHNSKTANKLITDITFDRTYWYSPYKQRRFENRWDQTFCILLIKDFLSVIESANLRQRQNLKKVIPDSNLDFRINLDADVRRISVWKLWIYSSASFISPSLVQIGCWLYENWENREMLTNVGKSPIPQWQRIWKSDAESTRISGSPLKVNHF